jgi:hypothetical protein
VQNKLFEMKIEKRTTKTVLIQIQTFFFANDYKAAKVRAFKYTRLEICTNCLVYTYSHTHRNKKKKKKKKRLKFFLRIGLKLKEIKIFAQTHT